MKTCPKCGELNGEERTTCFSCRKVLENTAPYQKVCPKCRAVYSSKTERCEDCGVLLAVYDPRGLVVYTTTGARWWHYVIAIFLPLIGLIMALVYLNGGENELAKTMLTTVVVCAVIQIVLGVLLAACGMLA